MSKRLPPFNRPSEARSRNMRAIQSTANASTEKRLASFLMRRRLRGWKVRPKKLPGTPDIVFPGERVAVFVDGCFFHGHPNCGHVPKTNTEYWRAKILGNRKRDVRVSRKLRSMGYAVIRIWECRLRRRPAECLNRVLRVLMALSALPNSRG